MDSVGEVSFAQERLWFLDQLRPGTPDYLLPLALRIRGPLDVTALTEAFQAIVDRHEVLRTRYVEVDGRPVAHVDAHAKVTIAYTTDHHVLERELARAIDIAEDLPFRLSLARLGDDHLLVFVVHHIAFDGWSWGVLARELAAGYAGRTAEVSKQAPQYAGFARWQRERFTDERSRRQLDYWRAQLVGVPAIDLPTDRPRPRTWDGTGDVVRVDLSATLLREVDALARSRRVTRFMVLLAAFQIVLARASGQTDFAVGTPVAGRTRVADEDLIGLFVNSIVLRADLSGAPTFEELLIRVRDTALGAFSHAETPFERIVTDLAPERDLSRNPLFQVSFSLLDVRAPMSLPGLDVELVEPPLTGSPLDLFLDINVRTGGTAVARLQYATALFDRARVERLAQGFVDLLRAIVAEPEISVSGLAARLELGPDGERDRLLHAWNGTAEDLPDGTVDRLIAVQAQSTPDAVAVRTTAEDITYAELDTRVNRLAHHLRALGVRSGSLVAVLLDRGPDLLTALLAVLRAGGAYVPIDPEYPDARVAFIVVDSAAEVVITRSTLADRVGDTDGKLVLLDRDRAAVAARRADAVGPTATADDLAYLIYTSGSTGTPKGVMVHHRALTNFVTSIVRRPGLTASQSVVALTTISFDPSLLELYVPLLVGATVVLADAEQARDPQRLTDLVALTRPAVLQATPAMLRALLDTGWVPPARITVLSGGEKLPSELARRLAAEGAQVWDLYGPTETTVWVTSARLDPAGRVVDWSPQANCTVHLLDRHAEPVPIGSVGELYVGGTCVALGYRGQPALTAERYVPDPYSTTPGGRLYRTGDLARRHQDGSVEILGRADRQVKIRGHRMEPSEIEAALLGHDEIRAVAVHPTSTPAGEQQLTAYIVPRGDTPPPVEGLRTFLRRTLPDYMVPAAYVPMEALPLTPNGKVDYNALPEPAIRVAVERVSPRTTEERVVAGIWQEVLGSSSQIGVNENFFDIGGHSLLATRVAVRLRAQLGIDVPVRGLFDHSTVASLAAALTDYPQVSQRAAMPTLTARRRRVTR